MRTLLYHDGALGDVLLSLPCMQAMREDRGEFHFAGHPDAGKLLAALAIVDGHTSSDCGMFASLFASGVGEKALAFLEPFDRAFVFAVKQDPDLMTNLGRAIPEVRAILTVPPPGTRTHVADFRLMQLTVMAQDVADRGLAVPSAVRDAALPFLIRAGHDGPAELIVIHPGSGGKRKCWPLERYFDAAERLAAGSGRLILFLSGPAEGPEMRERITQFVGGRERMAHLADADLVTVAGLLSRCGLSIGNDSGISHLAAVVRCPVISLFGPTDPALWSPRGPAVQVIAADALESITVGQVAGAADAMLSRPSFCHCIL